MSFAPPAGPPAPKVPEGWTAQFDHTYQTWFYVNLATGKSQWDRPNTPPAHSPVDPPPADSPPPYNTETSHTAVKKASIGDKKELGSKNPYNNFCNQFNEPGVGPDMGEDARLAAQLQAEEDARGQQGTSSTGGRGASDDYYNKIPQHSGPSYAGPSQSPMPPEKQKRSKRDFLSKLIGGRGTSTSRPHPPHGSSPSGAYYRADASLPSVGYQPGYGYPGPSYAGPGYGGPGYGRYPQGGFSQQPSRRQGGGMGPAGAAALGVGGGLLGGMLLADAIEDGHGDYGDGDFDGGGFDGGGFDGGDFGGDF